MCFYGLNVLIHSIFSGNPLKSVALVVVLLAVIQMISQRRKNHVKTVEREQDPVKKDQRNQGKEVKKNPVLRILLVILIRLW